ncbi:MAG: helix-turn-helix domain-containing protein [Phycisphaerae bacterium]
MLAGLGADRPATRIVAGLSHPRRLAVCRAIAAGADSHRLLSRALGLATGPLYHHIRALERAGVIAIARRNQYELTPAGRRILLALAAVA